MPHTDLYANLISLVSGKGRMLEGRIVTVIPRHMLGQSSE
jgi:hypothetical protein